MTHPSLILFDCDGVLVDSEPLSIGFLRDDFARHGLDLSLTDCERLFVGKTTELEAEIARDMGAKLPGDWVDTYEKRVNEHLKQGVPLVRGVLDVLNQLTSLGIAHCIVSNGSEDKMQITLTPNGLWDRFQGAIFSAYTHGVAKPDPELLFIAARQFGVDPANCLMVDDSATGCQAAANAGMPCVGYAERSDPETLSETGATVIRSMAELPAILGI